jgi:hypothetical protein
VHFKPRPSAPLRVAGKRVKTGGKTVTVIRGFRATEKTASVSETDAAKPSE